jgi:hypothetical protein
MTQVAHGLCDRCWALKYSTQFYGGQHIKYADMFKKTIGDMAKKPDEPREDWFKRCEEYVRSRGFASTVSKIKGPVATEVGSTDDTGSVQSAEAG